MKFPSPTPLVTQSGRVLGQEFVFDDDRELIKLHQNPEIAKLVAQNGLIVLKCIYPFSIPTHASQESSPKEHSLAWHFDYDAYKANTLVQGIGLLTQEPCTTGRNAKTLFANPDDIATYYKETLEPIGEELTPEDLIMKFSHIIMGDIVDDPLPIHDSLLSTLHLAVAIDWQGPYADNGMVVLWNERHPSYPKTHLVHARLNETANTVATGDLFRLLWEY